MKPFLKLPSILFYLLFVPIPAVLIAMNMVSQNNFVQTNPISGNAGFQILTMDSISAITKGCCQLELFKNTPVQDMTIYKFSLVNTRRNPSQCLSTRNHENMTYYTLLDVSQKCVSTVFCMPLNAITPVDNIIGYDVVLAYDPKVIYPTGLIRLSNDLIDTNIVDIVHSINELQGRINISAYFKENSPVNSKFRGTGTIFCVEFAKKHTFKDIDTTEIHVLSLMESYPNGVQFKNVNSGKYTSYKDSLFFASIRFWADNKPIKFNFENPSEYLITNIFGNNDSCKKLPIKPVQPDTFGNFRYNILNGLNISIHRDISQNLSVQPVINGYDAFQVRRLLADDPNFYSSIFQMIAMDVNIDGVINEKDLIQINQRTLLIHPQFKQVWNHTENGGVSDLPSKDWLFVDSMRILYHFAYQRSTVFPFDDGIGFSKSRVPMVPFCLPAPILNAAECPLIKSEAYKGILLGDVDGSYQNIPNEGWLKSNDKVIFDLTSVVMSANIIEIPVLIKSFNSVNAFDFSMQFNDAKWSFSSISNHLPGLHCLDYFNPIDSTLRFTSNSLQEFNLTEPILSIRCLLKSGQLNADDLISPIAYLNGEPVDVEIRVTTETLNNAKNIIASIYPNPTKGIINFMVLEDAKVELFDIHGKSLIAQMDIKAKERKRINVDHLSDGVYLMRIFNPNYNVISKIMILKDEL